MILIFTAPHQTLSSLLEHQLHHRNNKQEGNYANLLRAHLTFNVEKFFVLLNLLVSVVSVRVNLVMLFDI
jgi:hypothetical protein